MKKATHTLLALFSLTLLISCGKRSAESNEGQTAAEKVTKTDQNSETFYTAIQGAWTTQKKNASGEELTVMTIVMDGFLAETFYNVDRKEFEQTFGGSWSIDQNVFTLKTEFSSANPKEVGSKRQIIFNLKGDTITFQGDPTIWTRVDTGQKGSLSGAWLITGRERDGEMQRREPGPRKTMKILSDTRFQWIAYNTETKEFMGTGGGTYAAEGGEYTENLEFFSRDSSRVGAELKFNFALEDGEWHHSGLSSKGDPIHEVWSPRKE